MQTFEIGGCKILAILKRGANARKMLIWGPKLGK